MMKPKVAFLYTINPGVTWYRFYQFMQRMSELNLVESMLFPDWDAKRLMTPNWERKMKENFPMIHEIVSWADMVVIQYIYSPEGLSLVQAVRDNKPCFMEVDDFFSGVPHSSIAFDSNAPGDSQDYWSTRQMMESTGVIVTTQWLKNQYSKYNPNIHIIPNCIDFRLWDKEPKENEKVRIGWIGGATHEGDLKMVKEALYEVLDKYENVEVVICSSPPPNWTIHPKLKLMDKWAFIDEYANHVKSLNFDIGIAPLRDHNFNRAKSNLRYLEFSACGIPTVASDVEPFKKDFSGVNCSTHQEWVNALSRFIEDPEYRKREGQKAHDLVYDKFNLDKVCLDYYRLIMETTGHVMVGCNRAEHIMV